MSWQQAAEPECTRPQSCDPVETAIVPRARDIGDFEVRRALPAVERRMIGPFVFFDQMGPADLAPGRGIDVRPHPHIGLSTLTWLFDGEVHHRDTLGSDQVIRPGAVNWMTAGRGIAHSERTPRALRPGGSSLFGLQVWCALPRAHEETEPAFSHHPAESLPAIEGDGVRLVLVAGHGFGLRAPVPTFSETLYADAALASGATLVVPAEHEERGIYVVDGGIVIGGATFAAGTMLAPRPDVPVDVHAPRGARVVAIGGASMDGPRHLWWNFVSSSRERIEAAKAHWREGRFGTIPGDAEESIPLPER